MTAQGLFVTGTDTGVGKTRVAAALCRVYADQGLRVAAMKPVASGCLRTPEGLRNEDALALQAACNIRLDYGEVNPFAFEPPIAPHIAAADAGVAIDQTVLDRAFERLRMRSERIVVEGAGGWLVPLAAGRSFADLAVQWRLEVVLVVGLRLGCINHALLTAEAIERRGVRLLGWVGNAVDPGFERREENLDALRERIGAACLGVLPYAPQMSLTETAAILGRSAVLRSR